MTISTDAYCTPKWLADRLGTFDCDPCSNPRSHIKATQKYMVETGHDGLSLPWLGRTWLNHPYSKPMPWMKKLAYERAVCRCTESLVLAKLDCSTHWWQELTQGSCYVWLFHDRVQFDIPPDVLAEMQRIHEAKERKGKVNTSNNFCSALIHHGSNVILDLHDIATLWVKP